MQTALVASPRTELTPLARRQERRRIAGLNLVGSYALTLIPRPRESVSPGMVTNRPRNKHVMRSLTRAKGSVRDLAKLTSDSGVVALPPLSGAFDVAYVTLLKRKYKDPIVIVLAPIARMRTSAA